MNGSWNIALPTLTLILLASTFVNTPSSAMVTTSDKGPRTEDLIIKFYENLESAYSALHACMFSRIQPQGSAFINLCVCA